jgi:hypothetical protein
VYKGWPSSKGGPYGFSVSRPSCSTPLSRSISSAILGGCPTCWQRRYLLWAWSYCVDLQQER